VKSSFSSTHSGNPSEDIGPGISKNSQNHHAAQNHIVHRVSKKICSCVESVEFTEFLKKTVAVLKVLKERGKNDET